MEDLVPKLLTKLSQTFQSRLEADDAVQQLLKQEALGYEQVDHYAIRVGELLGDSMDEHISSATLPNGRMYCNIAHRIFNNILPTSYRLVADYASKVQTDLNHQAQLGIQGLTADLDQGRIDGLVQYASDADLYDDISSALYQHFITFNEAIVTDTIQKNVEFHAKSGMRPKITRRYFGGCKWCRGLAGTYDYPDVPHDVYRRHNNCRCIVEYFPGNGKRRDVWSKQWYNKGNKTESFDTQRRELVIDTKQFGKKAGKHMIEYGLDPKNVSDRRTFENITKEIYNHPSEIVSDVEWRGQASGRVTAYIKDNDAVLVDNKNRYVTTMKGGTHNARIENARRKKI